MGRRSALSEMSRWGKVTLYKRTLILELRFTNAASRKLSGAAEHHDGVVHRRRSLDRLLFVYLMERQEVRLGMNPPP